MYQFYNSREFLVDLIPCSYVHCVTSRKSSNGWQALDYIEEWSMCKKNSWRKWSFTDLGKRERGKASLVDPEKRMKLCNLLICSTAGTCWTVILVKLSKVTSPGSILLNCWKFHRLLLCFDSLFDRSYFALDHPWTHSCRWCLLCRYYIDPTLTVCVGVE